MIKRLSYDCDTHNGVTAVTVALVVVTLLVAVVAVAISPLANGPTYPIFIL